MKILEVKDLEVNYGKDKILSSVNFSLEKGQIGCLLGPSGCGKTTSLRTIAGFEKPIRGEIIINGQTMVNSQTFVETEKRGVGMVFQDIALFPHLTILDNIRFGIRSWPQKLRDKRCYELLEMISMYPKQNIYPHELSGGEQQ